ncbi:hypothetical protein J6590_014780 [Homalodisca vitripennis]|nr:hypothetical protein J6590_014780 [Homalodisca vitripennis]
MGESLGQLLVSLTTTSQERFGCPTCGRSYKNKKHLTTHLRFECGKEPQFACPLCPYKAKQKGTLKTHLALKHTQG